MNNQEKYKRIKDSGLLDKDILDYCLRVAESDKSVLSNNDIAEAIVILGYLRQEQVDELLEEKTDMSSTQDDDVAAQRF